MMTHATVHFITGGQRSGKSSFAHAQAETLSSAPHYLATARLWDDDFKDRVKRHKSDRGSHWTTIEEEINLDTLELTGKVVVVDCITLWLTNLFHDASYTVDTALTQGKNIWDRLLQQKCTLLVVSNEIGMSIHAEHESARKFTDLQGWMNQYIAHRAQKVSLIVSGIELKVK
ncbi:MAG: bifunctional adenosylcobinamide kinase/adenosylcobinamide-phosphate guanylyltransferase [Fibrobacterales bacterium]